MEAASRNTAKRRRWSPPSVIFGLVAAVLAFASSPLPALYVQSEEHGYLLDLPVGWERVDSERLSAGEIAEPADVFSSIRFFRGQTRLGDESVLAEAVLFEVERNSELFIDAVVDAAAATLDASGDAVVFTFDGREALFAEVGVGRSRRGYLVGVELESVFLVLVATVPEARFRAENDVLLSVIDGLGPMRPMPGPVAHFFESGDASEAPEVTLRFPGPQMRFNYPEERVFFSVGGGAADTGEMLVEREARLLGRYQFAGPGENAVDGDATGGATGGATGDESGGLDRRQGEHPINQLSAVSPMWLSSWRRYFRLIYRDTYPRLETLAAEIEEYVEAYRIPAEYVPDIVLSWLQAFEFRQAANAGLFQPPVVCLISASGDCDSLGMTYVVLMHHLGYDAALFVSIDHRHALAGVSSRQAVAGPGEASGQPEGVSTDGRTSSGRTFTVDRTEYLLAELTTGWPLGSIAAQQTDQAAWHFIPLGR